MATIHKVCINCAKPFPFTTSDQNFYREHGYADPKRCLACRRAYKRAHGQQDAITPDKCIDCNPKLVRGVVTDENHNCLVCQRHIEKTVSQYPVLAHHLRGQDASA